MKAVDGLGMKAVHAIAYSTLREASDGRAAFPQVPALYVPLGVDEKLFETQDESRKRGPIVFLSRVARKKRLDLVLQAMAIIVEKIPGARLVVAGPLDRDLDFVPTDLTEELRLSDAVTYIGPVDAAGRRRLLGGAAVFVLPSDDESFGMAPAEAMAAGCPVVLSPNVGIAPTAARAGAALIAPQTPEDIASAIMQVLELDEDEYAGMSAHAREYARQEFDWRIIAQTLRASYARLAAARPAATNITRSASS
jgi:glycosyltransferase involved in cell wall biosynthesis